MHRRAGDHAGDGDQSGSPLVDECDIAAGELGAVAGAFYRAEGPNCSGHAQYVHKCLLARVQRQPLEVHILELGSHLGHVGACALLYLRPAQHGESSQPILFGLCIACRCMPDEHGLPVIVDPSVPRSALSPPALRKLSPSLALVQSMKVHNTEAELAPASSKLPTTEEPLLVLYLLPAAFPVCVLMLAHSGPFV